MITILSAQETIFFSQHGGQLCQWVEAVINNATNHICQASARVTAAGQSVETKLDLLPDSGAYRVYAPTLWPNFSPDLTAHFTLTAGDWQAEVQLTIGTHRPWMVYLLSDVCVDDTWAYEDADRLHADDAALVLAELETADRYASAPEANQNHYNLVHVRELDYFMEYYPEQKERLLMHLKQGTLTLNPIYNMSTIANMSIEEFLRSLYRARRLAQQEGLDDTYANIQETPTAPWAAASLLARSGIRHVVRSLLPYECPWAVRLEEPLIFRWEGPDGNQVMMRLRKQDYVEGRFVVDGLEKTNQALHERILPAYQAESERYPYSAIGLVGCYGDLSPDSPGLPARKAEAIASYDNQGWEYPRLVNASHRQFWDDIEQQIAARGIDVPVYRGDYGTSWEAWAACLAVDLAGWRAAQEKAATADRLAAILTRLNPEWLPAFDDTRQAGWLSLLRLADHAWNGSSDGSRQLNAALRRTWQTDANTHFDKYIRAGIDELSRHIAGPKAPGLVVFNPLGWERSGVLQLDNPPIFRQDSLIDSVTGETVPVQWCEEAGKTNASLMVPTVPSVGYRVLHIRQGQAAAETASPWSVGENYLDGPFYRLEIDSQSGALCSLYDKTRHMELVDAASPYQLNEFVYHAQPHIPETPPAYQLFHGADLTGMIEHRSRLVSIEPAVCGPVYAEITAHCQIQELQVATTYRLYAGVDQLDIQNEVSRAVATEKQELDIIFPFAVADRQIRYESTGAILTPGTDQRAGAGLSIIAVRRFIDLFNDTHGVTLSALDSGFMMFGHRTTGEDPLAPDTHNSTVLALALGNSLDWFESIKDQGGATQFIFRFSLRGHAGGFDAPAALHFGWEAANALLAVPLNRLQSAHLPGSSHAFLTVKPDAVILTGLKPAEDGQGLAARLWKCTDEACEATISLSGLGDVRNALLTDLLESDLLPTVHKADQVKVKTGGRGFSALRIE